MRDPISRQAAIDALAKRYDMEIHDRIIAVETIDSLPSAQPESIPQFTVTGGEPQEFVPIIRCAHCKNYVSSGWCEGVGTCVSADDFCSRAERRTDEDR